jgi:5-methylcytosine-specific restriction protein B
LARYNPHHDAGPIHAAAAAWSKSCLLEDGSILQEGLKLWVPNLIDELDKRFVQTPDEGEGDFFEKLKSQLSAGSAECRQLMAEILWILMLFQSNVGAAKKRENVRLVWSWSGAELPEDNPMLSDAVLEGLGSAGTAYNTQRWRELAFMIFALRDFKRRDRSERHSILNDGSKFTEWLTSLPGARNRQLRHILPHLLFPDTFERMSSEKDKRLILAAYMDEAEKELRKWDLMKIDHALLDVRRRLEKERSGDIDFYEEEFTKEWRAEVKTWLLSWNPTKWTWSTLAEDREKTLRGAKVPHSWQCVSSKPREGDHVFLVRTGVVPKGIVAFGMVTRTPYDAPHFDKAKAEAGATARSIDVEFAEVRDATQDNIVLLSDLEAKEPEQTWNPQSSGIEIGRKPARSLDRLWKALPRTARTPGQFAETQSTASSPLNLILYGPPGTGKTYRLMTEFIPRYSDENGKRYEFVTFHQSYAYEDFIEGIRPITDNGQISYEVRAGVLKRLCERARKDPGRRYALFIDEINRGNIAKVFGELITLVEIDKRICISASGVRNADCTGLEVTLPYSGDRFGVPANVDFVGTMNTADRSIALLDTALRRRFQFEELVPQPRLIFGEGDGLIPDGAGGVIDLRHLLLTLNARLSHLLHRDQTIGHSYLYKVRNFTELRRVFAREILPLLQEFFYYDWRQIRLVLADQTVSDPEFQLVRARHHQAEALFPLADPGEVGDSESFEMVREDEITPDSIRKIYEPPE